MRGTPRWQILLGLALLPLLFIGATTSGGSGGLTAGTFLTNLTFGATGAIDSLTSASFAGSALFSSAGNGSFRLLNAAGQCWISAGSISTAAAGTCDTSLTRVAAGIMLISGLTDGTGAGALALGATTFASLGTPANGTVKYCSDCDATCAAGSSTGKMCARVNGAWAGL